MKNKLDFKLPREDWVIGMIQYDLEQAQLAEQKRMYGPSYLDEGIREARELLDENLSEKEHESISVKLEELLEARRRYGPDCYFQTDEIDEGEELSPWALEKARKHGITHVARQLIIDRMGKLNREQGRRMGDIAHLVRRRIRGYLYSMEIVESDAGALLNDIANRYDVPDIDEEAIDETIAKAREIFAELMLTPLD